jgi:hypothetical protein
MSAHSPPDPNVSLFNPNYFLSQETGSLTVTSADLRYLKLSGGILSGLLTASAGVTTPTLYNGTAVISLPSTGTSTLATDLTACMLTGNQTLSGQKSFTSGLRSTIFLAGSVTYSLPTTGPASQAIMTTGTVQTITALKSFTTVNGSPGGQALSILSFNTPFATRLYSVNSTQNTDLYFPEPAGTDTLVSATSTQTLSNKTLATLKAGSNGTSFSEVRQGTGSITYSSAIQYSQNSVAITFSPPLSGTPKVYITGSNSTGSQSSAIALSAGAISSSGFTAYGFYIFTSAFTGTVNFSWIAFV